jgi:hypothetical protein
MPTFSSKQLNEALYHATDITDRCLLPFFLMSETAACIVNEEILEGCTGIYLGVPIRYLAEYTLSTLRTLAKGADTNYGIKEYAEKLNKKGKICNITWVYRGVPIELKVINRNYSFFEHPDFKYYMAEEFKIPNPFENYYKARFLIQ